VLTNAISMQADTY